MNQNYVQLKEELQTLLEKFDIRDFAYKTGVEESTIQKLKSGKCRGGVLLVDVCRILSALGYELVIEKKEEW